MTVPSLLLERCDSCHGRFLPRPGRCPRCGSDRVGPHPVPPEGVVLAAVELQVPPPGWAAPHRLALVEVADSVRLLGVAGASLPEIGARVTVSRDGEVYRLTIST
jgi:uncharacterized OB-fold protein